MTNPWFLFALNAIYICFFSLTNTPTKTCLHVVHVGGRIRRCRRRMSWSQWRAGSTQCELSPGCRQSASSQQRPTTEKHRDSERERDGKKTTRNSSSPLALGQVLATDECVKSGSGCHRGLRRVHRTFFFFSLPPFFLSDRIVRQWTRGDRRRPPPSFGEL